MSEERHPAVAEAMNEALSTQFSTALGLMVPSIIHYKVGPLAASIEILSHFRLRNYFERPIM